MFTQEFLKRVLMFIGIILSGLITLIFVAEPEPFSVPDISTPSITTKSSQLRLFSEAKAFFESPVRNTVTGALLSSMISWSEDSKYLLANLKFSENGDIRTAPYILDFFQKKYTPVPDASWVDKATWAGSKLAYQTTDGFRVFDAITGEKYSFGKPLSSTFIPLISPDGSKVVYQENGLVFYNTVAKKDIRLTSNPSDIPVIWMDDSRALIFVRQSHDKITGKFQTELINLDLKPYGEKFIANLDKPFKQAKWVERGRTLLLELGFDDGNFDYLYNIETGEKKFIAETSEGLGFTSTLNRKVSLVSGNNVKVFDADLNKITESKLSGKERVTMGKLLSNGKLLLVRNVSIDKSKVTIFDPIIGKETEIGETWLPYVVIPPNEFYALTPSKGNLATQFIEIKQLTLQ